MNEAADGLASCFAEKSPHAFRIPPNHGLDCEVVTELVLPPLIFLLAKVANSHSRSPYYFLGARVTTRQQSMCEIKSQYRFTTTQRSTYGVKWNHHWFFYLSSSSLLMRLQICTLGLFLIVSLVLESPLDNSQCME